MLDVLTEILCWIKQIGAMVLSALVAAVNLVMAGLVGLLNEAISMWPIPMPDLPTMPDELGVAMQWLKWSPLPIGAMVAFFAFYVSVEVGWMVIKPILRWTRAGGEGGSQ